MEELRICSPSAHVGYGFPESSLREALNLNPHFIIAQGTSADPGPYYLGSGRSYTERKGVKRDLELLICAAKERGVKLICSLGGAGARVHLERALEIVNEICRERGIKLKAAVIHGEIDKAWLSEKLRGGAKARRLVPLDRFPEYLTPEEVRRSRRIVAQMGPEPIMRALDFGVEAVFAGRALDAALFAAPALREGFDPALSYHLAKVMECGALAAVPGSGSDGLFAELRRDCFLVHPMSPQRRCTPYSVAAHSLYERPDPHREEMPGGFLDVTEAKYEQVDDRTVKVWGARWEEKKPYTLKLEGAAPIGWRTISLACTRDPFLIARIEEVIGEVRDYVISALRLGGDHKLSFKIFGRPISSSSEIFIIIDAIAPSQEEASGICAFARSALLHWGFPGRKSTAGNLAFPFSPSDVEMGEVFIFNIWHALELEDPCEPFRIELREFPEGR